VSFNTYFGAGYLSTASSQPCFPNIQGCKKIFEYINLIPLPYGYSEAIFFTILFGLIVLGAYSLYAKKYLTTYTVLWILLLLKIFIILTNYGLGNFDYYDVILILIFLIYPARIDLVKLAFVLLYSLASTIKIHEGWIVGTYFSTLYYGLPLIPFTLIPVATNIVIIMQMVGCLLLLHSNKKVRDYTFYFFVFFHLYSTIIVGYRYPITSLLSLLVIFLVTQNTIIKKDYTFSKNNLFFYIIIVLLFCGQMLPYAIGGDQKFTLEANNYGLYMFEANHQCISTITTADITYKFFSYDARNRCDPYVILYQYKQKYCKNPETKILWTLDHSINGKPFKRMVDTQDMCKLSYESFTHNTWIFTEKQASTTGLPYKNIVLARNGIDAGVISNNGYLYPPFLSFSKPVEKTSLQKFMDDNLRILVTFYWTLWIATLLYMLYFAMDFKHTKLDK
jgi:hypothetical protein